MEGKEKYTELKMEGKENARNEKIQEMDWMQYKSWKWK